MNPRHAIAALTICLTSAIWSYAQTVEVAAPNHLHPFPEHQHAPTHAELSRPGALQAYVDSFELLGGTITIPAGKYKVDQLRLVRLIHTEIQAYGVTLIGTDPNVPTVRQAQTHQLTIRGLRVLSESDAAWSMEHWPGRGTLMTRFDGVTFERIGRKGKGFKRAGVGLRLARNTGELTCADVAIGLCEFYGFDRGIESNGRQVVRVAINDATQFVGCNYPLWINAGGQFIVDGQTGIIGARSTVTLGKNAGGSSLQPTVTLRDVYHDDAGGPTRIIDASRVEGYGQLRAVVDNVKANIANGTGDGFDLFVLPKNHPDAVIDVGRITKTGKANVVPEVVE